jgi:hypothetical protein
MASLVVIGFVAVLIGVIAGAYLKLSFTIRREDRLRGSLRFDAPTPSAQAARWLVGITASRWE